MDTFIDQFGIPRKFSHVRAVKHLEELKKKSGMNPWPVIEECFKVWIATNPTKWDSYLVDVQDVKETRKEIRVGGKRFRGVTKDKGHDGYISYTIDMPQPIQYMIRALYTPQELPMNKEFFVEFGRKFPHLRIREAKN